MKRLIYTEVIPAILLTSLISFFCGFEGMIIFTLFIGGVLGLVLWASNSKSFRIFAVMLINPFFIIYPALAASFTYFILSESNIVNGLLLSIVSGGAAIFTFCLFTLLPSAWAGKEYYCLPWNDHVYKSSNLFLIITMQSIYPALFSVLNSAFAYGIQYFFHYEDVKDFIIFQLF